MSTTTDAFTFTDRSDVALSTVIISNSITLAGINIATTISVVDGDYSINGGAFTRDEGTVSNGQMVSVRHTSSSFETTLVSTLLTIGGVSDTFTSTTGSIATGFASATGSLDTGFNRARGFNNNILTISLATDGGDDMYIGAIFLTTMIPVVTD